MSFITFLLIIFVVCVFLFFVFIQYVARKYTGRGYELSKYVTISVIVPEAHAARIRTVMQNTGAGNIGNYTHCSFSTKGIGRFMPNEKSNPFNGTSNKLTEVIEEKIETIGHVRYLAQVVKAIKEAHPDETTNIDIVHIYKIGIKLQR